MKTLFAAIITLFVISNAYAGNLVSPSQILDHPNISCKILAPHMIADLPTLNDLDRATNGGTVTFTQIKLISVGSSIEHGKLYCAMHFDAKLNLFTATHKYKGGAFFSQRVIMYVPQIFSDGTVLFKVDHNFPVHFTKG